MIAYNVAVLAACLAVEAELTPRISAELVSQAGSPGPEFAHRCVQLRNEALKLHGVSLEDWFKFNKDPNAFGVCISERMAA